MEICKHFLQSNEVSNFQSHQLITGSIFYLCDEVLHKFTMSRNLSAQNSPHTEQVRANSWELGCGTEGRRTSQLRAEGTEPAPGPAGGCGLRTGQKFIGVESSSPCLPLRLPLPPAAEGLSGLLHGAVLVPSTCTGLEI